MLADRFFVLTLKIHCLSVASHLNAASGVVETTSSLTDVVIVPLIVWTRKNDLTTPGVPTEIPLASHTRNFDGTVDFCLNTLVPPASIGCRIWWPASPLHIPASAYLITPAVLFTVVTA